MIKYIFFNFICLGFEQQVKIRMFLLVSGYILVSFDKLLNQNST